MITINADGPGGMADDVQVNTIEVANVSGKP